VRELGRALDAREPVSDERMQEVLLLVGQCVARVIDHSERGVRVVAQEVCGGRVPDHRVQPPATTSVGPRTPTRDRDLPSFTDSLEHRLVDERGGRGDIAFLPLQQSRFIEAMSGAAPDSAPPTSTPTSRREWG
jgi:hypothetical protein